MMKSDLENLIDLMISRGILFEEAVSEFEKHFILKVVDQHHNNLSKAASQLGIHRNTLSKRLLNYKNEQIVDSLPMPPDPVPTLKKSVVKRTRQ
jgi:DNA-binding NtrC family response regulator